jgi:hypothetical protein
MSELEKVRHMLWKQYKAGLISGEEYFAGLKRVKVLEGVVDE